jgi:hypothetical protein
MMIPSWATLRNPFEAIPLLQALWGGKGKEKDDDVVVVDVMGDEWGGWRPAIVREREETGRAQWFRR